MSEQNEQLRAEFVAIAPGYNIDTTPMHPMLAPDSHRPFKYAHSNYLFELFCEGARRAQPAPTVQAEPTSLLNAEQLAALRRFDETCEDGEGYDVPKHMMKELAGIGVVQRTGGAWYRITAFGTLILDGAAPAHASSDGRDAKDAARCQVVVTASTITVSGAGSLANAEEIGLIAEPLRAALAGTGVKGGGNG